MASSGGISGEMEEKYSVYKQRLQCLFQKIKVTSSEVRGGAEALSFLIVNIFNIKQAEVKDSILFQIFSQCRLNTLGFLGGWNGEDDLPSRSKSIHQIYLVFKYQGNWLCLKGYASLSFTIYADKEGTKRDLSYALFVHAGLKTAHLWKQHFYFCSFY